jgi:hypothetical protein
MEFVRKFDEENSLLSVKYDNEKLDEFEKIFDRWTDVGYLLTIWEKDQTRRKNCKNSKSVSNSYWMSTL